MNQTQELAFSGFRRWGNEPVVLGLGFKPHMRFRYGARRRRPCRSARSRPHPVPWTTRSHRRSHAGSRPQHQGRLLRSGRLGHRSERWPPTGIVRLRGTRVFAVGTAHLTGSSHERRLRSRQHRCRDGRSLRCVRERWGPTTVPELTGALTDWSTPFHLPFPIPVLFVVRIFARAILIVGHRYLPVEQRPRCVRFEKIDFCSRIATSRCRRLEKYWRRDEISC